MIKSVLRFMMIVIDFAVIFMAVVTLMAGYLSTLPFHVLIGMLALCATKWVFSDD